MFRQSLFAATAATFLALAATGCGGEDVEVQWTDPAEEAEEATPPVRRKAKPVLKPVEKVEKAEPVEADVEEAAG